MSVRRYAIVCPGLVERGAVANVALRHAQALSSQAEVVMVSDGFPEDVPSGVKTITCRAPSFHWLRRFGHVPREWAFARAACRELQNLARRTGLDAVMCHGHVVASLTAARFKQRSGVPYALVTHGDIFDRPAGTYDPLLTAFYKAVTPKAYREADLILALSPHMHQLALRWAHPSTRIEVVPNGVDMDEISAGTPAKAPIFKGNGLKILYVGRLSVEKGVEYLIKAMGLLRQQDIRAELCLIGDGPLRPQLQNLVHQLGLDNIQFCGRRLRGELAECYLQADVLCVPSLSDPLPTVALEGMAAGRPIVGSRVGGIPFLVEDQRSGILVDAGSEKALADALASCAANPVALMAMGRAAGERARARFSWAAVGKSLALLMSDLTRS